jgi:hypothetical protein
MSAGIIALEAPQVLALLNDRLDGAGPCDVNEGLDWPALAATSVVPGARRLMAELAGEGARLTGQGYLNRKLVARLVDSAPWPGVDKDVLRSICKVFNEYDFAPAEYLHAIVRVAGLARREKGHLKLTVKGRKLVAEEHAGWLHAELFRLTFTRYNLAYLDGADEPDAFGPQIGLILYLIGQFAIGWHPADELMRSVTLPAEKEEDPRYPWRPGHTFVLRVLRYLCWFGMLEEKRAANLPSWDPGLFRKTPLYDRTLAFNLDRGVDC